MATFLRSVKIGGFLFDDSKTHIYETEDKTAHLGGSGARHDASIFDPCSGQDHPFGSPHSLADDRDNPIINIKCHLARLQQRQT